MEDEQDIFSAFKRPRTDPVDPNLAPKKKVHLSDP